MTQSMFPVRPRVCSIAAIGVALLAVLALAPPAAAGAVAVEVEIGDLGLALRPLPGGWILEPSVLPAPKVRVTKGGEAGAEGRMDIGGDGLPVLTLRVPLARPAGAISARITSTRFGKELDLQGPFLSAPPIPVGEGAPAPPYPAPVVAGATAPEILHVSVAQARGASEVHVTLRIGRWRTPRLEWISKLGLELSAEPAASDASERLAEVTARYARVFGRHPKAAAGTETAAARGPWVLAPPSASALAPTRDGGPVDVVIVTSEALRPEFERLAEFRTRLGQRALVRTVEWIEAEYGSAAFPDRAARIRAFLARARSEWGTLWVLLGGDSDVIPPRYAASTYFVSGFELIPADLYFAALDGDWNADGDQLFGEPEDQADLVPDLFVGRAPVSTRDEARSFVERQIAHELGSGAGSDSGAGAEYPATVLFLAEQLFESFDGAEVAEEARQLLPPSLTTVRLYERSGSYPGAQPESRESALAALNTGSGLVLHIGHGFRNALSVGAGSLSNADVDALGNRPRLPVFLALNCTSAAIDFNSIGERLVKNPRGGAAVYIGSSRYAFPGTARSYQTTFFHAAFQESLRTAGEAVGQVRSLLAPLGTLEGAHRWTQLALTLLGDPLTPLFTRAPEPLVLRYPAVITGSSIPLAVTAGGAPVAGARVSVLAADGTLAIGFTDPAGEASLPVAAGAPGPYLVAAVAPDTWPALGAVSVAGGIAEAFLAPGDLVVSPDASGNVIPEPGETVALLVPVANWGGAASTAGQIALTVRSGPATLVTGDAPLPSIAPGAGITAGPFEIALAADAPDGAVVTVEVALGGVAAAPARRALAVGGSKLRLVGRTLDGPVDPGSTCRLALVLANDGGGPALAVRAAARVLDAETGLPATSAALIDSTSRFGDLRPGEVTEGEPFVLALDPGADPGALRLEVTIQTALGPAPPIGLDFVAPLPPSGLGTRGSASAIHVTWDPVPATDLLGYEIERAPAGGVFTRITDRPIAGAVFEDLDLPALTGFEYRVTAVDSSGNPSTPSAPATGTTNPALHAGWPIQVGQESASSPTLMDLDGDGAAEIVTGADALYVWHGDGNELRDGDATELTSGVFSTDGMTLGKGFHSTPAVANLDGDAAPELVGVAWNAAQVFVWNLDGSRVPGWPQNLAGPPNWGSPAVGDLDGDGQPEISVVSGADGRVYAWHRDGSEVRDGDQNPATSGVLFASGAAFSFASPALGDLDGDGAAEVVIGLDEDSGTLHALRAAGGEAPGWPRALGGRISASPAIGDLAGNSAPEIVIAVEDDSLHALFADGTPVPGWPQWAFIENAPARTSSPILADLDLDGHPEVIFAENSGPTHVARLRVFEADGDVFPGFDAVTFATDAEASGARATQSTPVVGDVDGDGRLEILLGAEDGQLYAWNDDGTPVAGFPIQTGGEIRGSAALGDVDGDGLVEAVVLSWDRQLYVWDLNSPARADRLPWPAFRHDAANTGNALAGLLVGNDGGPKGSGSDGGSEIGGGPQITAPTLRAPAVLRAGEGAGVELELPRAGAVRLRLCGVAGRVEREIFAGELPAGRQALRFDGRSAGGRPRARGVDRLELPAPGGAAVARLLVLR
jgi:hypothetical protein